MALADVLGGLDDHVSAVELRERRGRLVPRAASLVALADLRSARADEREQGDLKLA